MEEDAYMTIINKHGKFTIIIFLIKFGPNETLNHWNTLHGKHKIKDKFES